MKNVKKGRCLLALLLGLCLAAGLTVPTLAAEPPAEPSITAAAAVVMDFDTGEILYAKNADARRAPASMTKVMCAYIIFEELAAGNITYDTLWTVGRESASCSVSGVSNAGPLYVGQQITVDMALRLIFLPSASACCVLAAENISGGSIPFIQRMNDTARRLGIDAYYVSTNGTVGGELVSPRAQAALVRDFIQKYPEVLSYTSQTHVQFNGVTWTNCNKLLTDFYYPGCDGFKTGTMSAAGCCLTATAQRDGKRLISVVMGSWSDSARFTDSRAVLDYGFAMAKPTEPYWDVNAGAWYAEPVFALRDLGAEMSLANGKFQPDAEATRAQFVAMFVSALQARGMVDGDMPEDCAFADSRGHWAESYIALAAELEFIHGRDENTFAPNETITREEMAVIMDNAWQMNRRAPLDGPDAEEISQWAEQAVAHCLAAELFLGDPDGSLRPRDSILRSETAAILWRGLNAGLKFG